LLFLALAMQETEIALH